jgi:hypothetical protein
MRHATHPDSFSIPARQEREAVAPGDAVKLLFDIETREAERVIDRGVDRMWVIVKHRVGDNYVGVLDSEPGVAEGLTLHSGTELVFGAEHIVEIDHPPRSYVIEKYGTDFFR